MNGIGGDLFAIVYDPKAKRLAGLNASGRAGRAATPAEFAKRGVTRMPEYGPLTVTVPGVVDGWANLLKRHGTISLARALAPAIVYARDGFPVSEIIAVQWKGEEKRLAADPAAAATFLRERRRPGARAGVPQPAAGCDARADRGRRRATRSTAGRSRRAIARDMRARQGLIDESDLAAHRSDWVEPISTTYRGYDVFELPFNTQGFVALEMLNILEGFDLARLGHNSADYLHRLVEANRIAFADRAAYLADAGAVPAATQAMLLSKDYAARRRAEIRPDRAAPSYAPGRPSSGGRDAVGRRPRQRHGRHHLPDRRGRRRERRVADPVALRRLRFRRRRGRHRDCAAEPRRAVHARGGPPEPDRARQASVPHAGARDGDEGRPPLALVRRDGRRHAAAGARAGAAEPDRVRHERPGGGRGGPLPAGRVRRRARVGDQRGRPRGARPRAATPCAAAPACGAASRASSSTRSRAS